MSLLELRNIFKELNITPSDLVNADTNKMARFRHRVENQVNKQNLDSLLARIQNHPSDVISSTHRSTFNHTYHAQTSSGYDDYFKTNKCTYNITLPTINPEISRLIKEIWGIPDKTILDINRRFEGFLLEFVKQIIAIETPTPFNLVFFSSSAIEPALHFLINHTDKELSNKINKIKLAQPKYDTFDDDIDEHGRKISEFLNDYLNKDAFKTNLLRVYLDIIGRPIQPEPNWLFDIRNYAYLTAFILKIPIMVAYLTITISVPIIVAIGLICAAATLEPLATIAILSALVGTALLINYYFNISLSDIDAFINAPLKIYATFTDRLVETIFDVKQHANHLSATLFEGQVKSPRQANLNSTYQYLTKFSFMTSSANTNNHDTVQSFTAESQRL